MRRSKSVTRVFFLDTDLFVSAIKKPRKETAALRLILHLIGNLTIGIVANDILLEELA